eukprot:m.377389 g.377389  ORF g.377389 m.377389 type:complete len:230 (+) comp16705_c4_seq26:253-942(+)
MLYDEIVTNAPSAKSVLRTLEEGESIDFQAMNLASSVYYDTAFTYMPTTENGYLGGYDQIFLNPFKNILRLAAGSFSTERDAPEKRKESTTAGTKRPDILVVYKNMAIYKAEEKKGAHQKDPRVELVDKMGMWSVVSRGSTTFLLSHIAEGWDVEFFVLEKDTPVRRRSVFSNPLKMTSPPDRFKVCMCFIIADCGALITLHTLSSSDIQSRCQRNSSRDLASSNPGLC